MALTAQQALWFELMQFYIREAWLLDERKLKEWLDLFTDDVLYFMPRRKNVPRREAHRELTPQGDLAILEEDRRYLEMRVARLDTGMAWAEDPPSRTRHLIGNLEVDAAGERRGAGADRVSGLPLAPGDGSSAPLRLPRGCAAQGGRRMEGGEAHDRARRQRPPRQEPQRVPVDQQPNAATRASRSVPRRNASTCAAHSAGFSNGGQCPQLFSSTRRESAMWFRIAMLTSKATIRS